MSSELSSPDTAPAPRVSCCGELAAPADIQTMGRETPGALLMG